MGIETLCANIKKKNNPTVAGLDPELSYVPGYIREAAYHLCGKTLEGAAEALWQFNRSLIDALYDIVPAVKPQSAYYEMYGLPGLITMDKTIRYAKEKGMYVILDVKRGDIGKTAAAYAAAYIGETDIDGEKVRAFLPDGITVNPYLGTDGLVPFVSETANDKSIFVLVKTSNPSSGELQDLEAEGTPVYMHTAALVAKLAEEKVMPCGYSNVGCVVGATYPKEAETLRQMLPHSFFLVPGYGAQGGGAADVRPCFDQNGGGAIVNSSRGIMCAYKRENCAEEDFAGAARREALRMQKALSEVL
ncbi:MAG: orotidine-5'-phosphate decarboxylase [Clostridia bacterium]|nr:orotidine-5'-phosphate decarboxylase [Clostridia bacterium]